MGSAAVAVATAGVLVAGGVPIAAGSAVGVPRAGVLVAVAGSVGSAVVGLVAVLVAVGVPGAIVAVDVAVLVGRLVAAGVPVAVGVVAALGVLVPPTTKVLVGLGESVLVARSGAALGGAGAAATVVVRTTEAVGSGVAVGVPRSSLRGTALGVSSAPWATWASARPRAATSPRGTASGVPRPTRTTWACAVRRATTSNRGTALGVSSARWARPDATTGVRSTWSRGSRAEPTDDGLWMRVTQSHRCGNPQFFAGHLRGRPQCRALWELEWESGLGQACAGRRGCPLIRGTPRASRAPGSRSSGGGSGAAPARPRSGRPFGALCSIRRSDGCRRD